MKKLGRILLSLVTYIILFIFTLIFLTFAFIVFPLWAFDMLGGGI